MAVDALLRLGRADAAASWAEDYVRRLDDAPASGQALAPEDRVGALGRSDRYGDWLATFEALLRESPWQAVLADALCVLLPGVIAAATHGLIRTGHAVRGLEDMDTPARRAELARAMAYWASVYVVLPGTPTLTGTLDPHAASRALPLLPEAMRTGRLITEEALGVGQLQEWEGAVNAAGTPEDVQAAFSGLTRSFAGWYLAEADEQPIAFVHGVTAPAAARLLLPYVPPRMHAAVYAYAWQACAALRVALGAAASPSLGASAGGAPLDRSSLDDALGDIAPEDIAPEDIAPEDVAFEDVAPEDVGLEELADRAVASGDAHAIKLTEACVREHRLAPDPVYVATALDVTARLAG